MHAPVRTSQLSQPTARRFCIRSTHHSFHAAAVVLATLLFITRPAVADNWTWGLAPLNTDWDDYINWSGGTIFSYPNGTGDTVTIGNVDPYTSYPILDANRSIGALTINSNSQLSLGGHNLVVNGGTHSGTTTVGGTGANLYIGSSMFDTDNLVINNGGTVHLGGGRLQVDVTPDINNGGLVYGYGIFEIAGATSNDLVNDGTIRATGGTGRTLTIRRVSGSTGEFDWDGGGGNGARLEVDSGATMIIDLPINIDGSSTDGFDGTIALASSSRFQVNYPWALGGGGTDPGLLDMGFHGTVAGESFTVHSDASIVGGGTIEIAASATNNLINNGSIETNGGVLTIMRLGGTAEFDWDGSGTNGAELNVGLGDRMIIDMPINGAGTDGFNGTINVEANGKFEVNQPWILGGGTGDAGILNLNGSVALPAVIQGTGSLTVGDAAAQINVNSGIGVMPSNLTVTAGTVTIASGAGLKVDGTATFGAASNMVLSGGPADLIVNSSFEHPGTISGSGQLIKSGPGTLTLTGNNSYTGGTTVDEGVLDANPSSLPGDVTINSQLQFEQTSGSDTYAGNINGSGALLKYGAGTVFLTGNNSSFSGQAYTYGGRLVVDALSLPSNVYAVSATEIEFNQNSSGTYAGNIIGSGKLIKTGTGNLTLTGNNTYLGGTTISDGRLTVDTNSLPFGSVVNNSELEFNQTFSYSCAGVISGTGSLIKSGLGNLTLTANNSYSGGTTINAGGLVVTTDSLPGDVTNNSSLVFQQSGSGTYAGQISGSGGLYKNLIGVVTLSGNNTYTGATIVNGGRLTVNTDSLPGDVNIFNNSQLEFNQASSGTYAGSISGTGSLIKSGAGNLTFSGSSNSYTGSTSVNEGTFTLGASNVLPNATDVVINGGTFALNNKTDTVNSLTLNSGDGTASADTLALTSTGNALSINHGAGISDADFHLALAGASGGSVVVGGVPSGGSTMQTPLHLGNVVRTIDVSDVNAAGNDLTWNGSISQAGGINKMGTGTMVVTAANTYSGVTNVGEGTLLVNNSTGSGTGSGSVTVESGATLGGNGNIDGPVFAEAGSTVAPGTSPGELTVDSIDFESGSRLELEIDGIIAGTSFDVLSVDGAVTLDGTLNGTVGYAADYGDSFQVMTFTSRTGVFSSVTDTGLAVGMVLAPFYSDTDLTLSVELAGDASGDGQVDIGDFTVWGDSFGMTGASYDNGDFSRDGHVDIGDFTVWGDHFGAMASMASGDINSVPEPSSVILAAAGLLALVGYGWRRRRVTK